ncbi:MAG: TonB-dependent receptor [Mucinivorans sp.]
MRHIGLLFIILLTFTELAMAQGKMLVNGAITTSDGSPAMGAMVVVKGTSVATLADGKGLYKLSVEELPKSILVVRYAGFKSQEIPIIASGTYNVVLEKEQAKTDDRVTLAQGFIVTKNAVTTSAVKIPLLNQGQGVTLMSGLKGKVAGMNISTAGGTGSTEKVILRGYSSMLGSNQPLYVVDGIPMGNPTFDSHQGVDFGNAVGDIDPRDVESVSVLKGAAATTLYGSRGANGVILVTTKRASEGESKFSLSYEGSFMGTAPLRWPKDWVDRNLYKSGFDMTNNLSVSMNTAGAKLVLAYGNTSSKGVLSAVDENFERNNISLRGVINKNKLYVDAAIYYVRRDMDKAYGEIYEQIYSHQEPSKQTNHYQNDRIYGKAEIGYDIISGLKVMGRISADFINGRQKFFGKVGDQQYEQKQNSELRNNHGQIDGTVLLKADYKLAEDKIGLDGFVGWNLNQRSLSSLSSWSVIGSNLSQSSSLDYNRRIIGLMGQVNFSLEKYWMVSLSARNDWSSTFRGSRFYWGISSSLIISDLAKIESEIVDVLKLRLAYGRAGNDTDPYIMGLQETLGNELYPEITTEAEVGVALGMFHNRLRADIGLYHKVSSNQIMALPLLDGQWKLGNGGKVRNQGVELMVGGTLIQNQNWQWDVDITLNRNWNKVVELPNNTLQEPSPLNGLWFGVQEGQPMGLFKDNNNHTIGTSATELAMGLTTTVTFKGLSLGATLDYRQGGLFFCGTRAAVVGLAPLSGNLLPREMLCLRELSLRYNFPAKWFGQGKAIKGFSLSLAGCNLLMWTPSSNRFVDPETTNLGTNFASEFGEYCTGPAVRTFGGSLKITF